MRGLDQTHPKRMAADVGQTGLRRETDVVHMNQPGPYGYSGK